MTVDGEEQFWKESGNLLLADVSLPGFRITDWFPRAPGVFWTAIAVSMRRFQYQQQLSNDPKLGLHFEPPSKMSLIEGGGIGTLRLRPKMIDGERCWFATAIKGTQCHAGIPLAIPDVLVRNRRFSWGDEATVSGQVRFLDDAGLDDSALQVSGTRPLIVFVDRITVNQSVRQPITITPVALFDRSSKEDDWDDGIRYTFVNCVAGDDGALDAAADWIQGYAEKFGGRIVTNYDEQRPVLADAPLSYQRLVARTYDRKTADQFGVNVVIEQMTFSESTNFIHEDNRMANNISVGGSAIINIQSVLDKVNQTIGAASGLDSAKRAELDSLVKPLNQEIAKLSTTHADEAKEIADALEKTVVQAAKPLEERKTSILSLSAKGLKDAAEMVRDIAPTILTLVETLSSFIKGLS